MARSRNGEAVRIEMRSGKPLGDLKKLRSSAKRAGDLATWRRCKAVLSYIEGKSSGKVAEALDVKPGAVVKWIGWYNREGADGLRTKVSPGRPPRLDDVDKLRLANLIEAGPKESGFDSGIWTGPLIGELIRKVFGVRYHAHHVPRLLHRLGFSVQRPRKRLARADAEAQQYWLHVRLPAIKKKPPRVVAS